MPADTRPEGAFPQHLAEVLRFDVSPGWIMARWPRVSTALAYLELHGYRVPLVTGTTPGDLAGSLTYYFNAQQQVQRIVFHGTTGDVRNVVTLLVTQYGFTRRLANSPAVILYEAATPDNKLHSVLRIQPVGVIRATEPNRKFDVDLIMERPGEKEEFGL